MKELAKRIVLDGTINTRDVGGYETKDGRHVQYGRLIRTDCLDQISNEDIRVMKEEFNIQNIVDFRSPSEVRTKPDRMIEDVTYYRFPLQTQLEEGLVKHPHEPIITPDKEINGTIGYIFTLSDDGDVTTAMEIPYRSYVSKENGQNSLHDFFRLLIDSKEGSTWCHCLDGKDRTGVAVALVLIALGVPEEVAIQDYLVSQINTEKKRNDRVAALHAAGVEDEIVINSIGMIAGVRENWLRAALDEVKTTFFSYDEFFHNQLRLSDLDLKQLQENLLD